MSTLNTTNLKHPSSGSNNIVLNTDGTTTVPTLSSTTITSTDITGTTIQGTVKSGTAVASTSGTSIDFTGIPSWVKKITVMFDRVSTSGASTVLIQLGDSGGIENTGYTGASTITGTGSGTTAFTAGAGLLYSGQTTSFVQNGAVQIANLTGNTWTIWGGTSLSAGSTQTSWTHSAKTLSDTLTQLRITTVNGTDTFDAGSINILYEG